MLLGPGVSNAAPPKPQQIELDWETYRFFRGDLDEIPSEPAAPHAAFRTITLVPKPEATPPGVEIRAVWKLRADRTGFVAGVLAGPEVEVESATIDGVDAPIARAAEGTVLAAYLRKDATLRLKAFVPAAVNDDDGGELDLHLLPAVRGSVELRHKALTLEPVQTPQTGGMLRTSGVLWTGAEKLGLRMRVPEAPDKSEGPLAVAHVGMGVTVGEGDVSVRANVVWTLRRGSLDTLTATVHGASDDLEVKGRGVNKWSRSGDTITVELAAPTSTRANLELHWTTSLTDTTEASFVVPRVEPANAFRTDTSLQLARDGEIEVVPTLDRWSPVPADELPAWGRGLVEGTPTAAYQRGQVTGDSGSLALLRFVPVAGPRAVVDVAEYTLALSEGGRLLGRAKYQVRNERAAFLRVTPPEGVAIVGARIAGETALPGRTEDGAWLIPLQRSLETVEGLLSFPVEITLLGDGEDWDRRERRGLPLPQLDAPIAVSRTTVYLPPEYSSKLDPGDGAVVDAFTEGEGITYGIGLGEEETAKADELLQKAVQDYRNNDFAQAQARLDELEATGASNENIARLQSNVDLVTGGAGGEGKGKGKASNDTAVARRVKDQARARATEEFARQRALEQEAEVLYQAGDYAAAEASIEAALDLGGKLENLEQAESVETKQRNKSLSGRLGQVKQQKDAKKRLAFGSKNKPKKRGGWRARRNANMPSSGRSSASVGPSVMDEHAPTTSRDFTAVVESSATASADSATVYDFEDDNLDGELLSPEGANIASRSRTKHAGMPVQIDNARIVVLDPNAVDVPIPVAAAKPPPEPEPEPEPMSEPEMDDDPEPPAPPARAGRAMAVQRKSKSRRGLGKKFKAERRAQSRRRERSVSMMSASEFSSRRARKSPKKAPDDAGAPTPTSARRPQAAELERLPAPEVTASALSVVIPAIGERVLYQTLLIEAGQSQIISVDARRRRRRHR